MRLAVEFWERGVRTLKFKTGEPGIDDVARLRAVRERLGPEPIFTIDANGAHATADEAVRAIEALLPFDLALAEQPTPRDRIGLLAEVRRRVPVPILADEAIFTPGHLDEALDLDAFDILSIYPGKNGGFTHSLAMARKAQSAGQVLRDRLEPRDRPGPGGDGLPGVEPVGLPGGSLRLRPDGGVVLRVVLGDSADRLSRRAGRRPRRAPDSESSPWTGPRRD